jgi:hypothetical protein
MSSYGPARYSYTAVTDIKPDCSLFVGEMMAKVLLVESQSVVAILVIVASSELFVE